MFLNNELKFIINLSKISVNFNKSNGIKFI